MNERHRLKMKIQIHFNFNSIGFENLQQFSILLNTLITKMKTNQSKMVIISQLNPIWSTITLFIVTPNNHHAQRAMSTLIFTTKDLTRIYERFRYKYNLGFFRPCNYQFRTYAVITHCSPSLSCVLVIIMR